MLTQQTCLRFDWGYTGNHFEKQLTDYLSRHVYESSSCAITTLKVLELQQQRRRSRAKTPGHPHPHPPTPHCSLRYSAYLLKHIGIDLTIIWRKDKTHTVRSSRRPNHYAPQTQCRSSPVAPIFPLALSSSRQPVPPPSHNVL